MKRPANGGAPMPPSVRSVESGRMVFGNTAVTASGVKRWNGAKKWIISKIFSLLLRDEVSIRRLPSVIKAGDENFGGVNFETV